MSVTLRKKANKDGSFSLYLDIYNNGRRSYEFMPELKLFKPSNAIERQANKDKIDLAKRIEIKRAQELAASDYQIASENGKKVNIVNWMQSFVDRYTKKDKRNMQGALNRFRDFLMAEKKQGLVFGHLTELIISDFQDYLRSVCSGEGSSSYFYRFKKMVKQAYRQKIIPTNPAAEIRTVKGEPRKRDILTLEEIQQLASTPTESDQVKRAALFSLVTGLRWTEIKAAKWQDISMSGKYIDVFQGKGEKYKRINLNDTALALIGEPGKPDQQIFSLPTANGANKTLAALVKRAGIDKHITWHCLRHSFGTNLVFTGSDVTTASVLLGHSSLKHTQRYVKTANELRVRATDKLNINL